jgi:hypothetical protein
MPIVATKMPSLTSGGTLSPEMVGRVSIDISALPAADEWASISLLSLPSGVRWKDQDSLFALSDGSRGVRVSFRHPPVVSFLRWCDKGSFAMVYVRLSEAGTKAAGTVVTLRYGRALTNCDPDPDRPDEFAFRCSEQTPSEPFSLTVSGAIVGMGSGLALAEGTMESSQTETTLQHDGCFRYVPIADAM